MVFNGVPRNISNDDGWILCTRARMSVHPSSDWRKVRSQTSDNMDRLSSRGGKCQRRERVRREKVKEERVRKKKIRVREKVAKSPTPCFSNVLWLRRGELLVAVVRSIFPS